MDTKQESRFFRSTILFFTCNLILVAFAAEIRFVMEPHNITIFSHETTLFTMPCAVEGTNSLPNWKIDNKLYTAATLPTGLIMVSNGLEIKTLTYRIFQCYLIVSNPGTPPPYYLSLVSSVGVITVKGKNINHFVS